MKVLEHSVTHLASTYVWSVLVSLGVWQLLASGAVWPWAHTNCNVSDGVARGVETAVGMYYCRYVMWLFIHLLYVDCLSYVSLCMCWWFLHVSL